MANFQVMLHGYGINIPGEGNTPSVIGFYTTRIAKGKTAAAAIEVVKEAIREEWRAGSYANANRGKPPTIEIETVTSVSWFACFGSGNKGYTFYSQP